MEQPINHHRPRRQDSALFGQHMEAMERDSQRQCGQYFTSGTIGHSILMRSWLAVILILSICIEGGWAIEQVHCSSQNTGKDHYVGRDQWQTLGLCRTNCQDFAFGVVRGYDCWCSDYIPNPANNKSDCNKKCPQYDQEYCGNPDTGSYGYIDNVILRPKGTAPPNDNTASSTTAKSSSTNPSPTPTSPYVSVITVDGPPKTITITPPGWVDPTARPDSKDNDFFSNTGRVAGVFTVVALLIIALAWAIFWFVRRRRAKGAPLGADSPTPDGFGGVMVGGVTEKRRSRSMSTLGLVSPFGGPDKPPPIITATSGSSGSTAMYGGTPDRVTDQRLDPGQVWSRFENDNASRMSIRSLRDDQDYSRRVLRLTNPDE